MNFKSRFLSWNKAADKFIMRSPLNAIVFGAISFAISYGGMMSLLTLFFAGGKETIFWAARLIGFPAILLIPSSINQTWPEEAVLILIFFVQGALLGAMMGYPIYLKLNRQNKG